MPDSVPTREACLGSSCITAAALCAGAVHSEWEVLKAIAAYKPAPNNHKDRSVHFMTNSGPCLRTLHFLRRSTGVYVTGGR